MSPEVIFMVDGKVVTTEKYSEIRSDVKLDPKLFDPQFWTTGALEGVIHRLHRLPNPTVKGVLWLILTARECNTYKIAQ